MKMKKLLSVLLALAMILCACNVLVLAEGETIVVGQGDDLQSIIDSMENGSTLVLGEDIDLSNNEETGLSGTGTAEDPFIVESVDDLKWFRDDVNGGNTYSGKYVKLTADIDLEQEDWTPIGNDTNKFQGYFDGGNHTISGLWAPFDLQYNGLFGYILGTGMSNSLTPSVQNLTLNYPYVGASNPPSGDSAGALAGKIYTAYVRNVKVIDGDINGGKWVGGVVGHAYCVFEDCSFSGVVRSSNQSGGIVGAGGDARCYRCYVDVSDTEDDERGIHATYWAGGIIGNGQEGTSAVDCYVKGNIYATSNWYRGVGGIAGVAGHGYAASEFKNNYFDGEVYLCDEKVDAVVMGIVNVDTNEDIKTTVEGNSWNTEYYPADLEVLVVGEVSSDATAEEWAAGAAEELTRSRNNNLVMLESDLAYVDAESVDDVIIMAGSTVTTEQVEEAIENNSYIPLPTATVNVLDADSLGLTFARQFIADEVSDTVLDEYGSWFADFVISFNKDVTFNANGGADGYLSGQYDAWSENWVNVPFEDVTVKANEPLKIMEYAAELMGQSGLKLTYNDVYNFVKNFSCGIYFTPEYLAANPDLKVDLSLSMFDPADETVAYAIGQSMEFVAPTVVAKVDEVGYATLQEAIDAANGKTVTVLKDIELAEGVTVAKGTDVTIDLNGKTVSYPVSKATTTWAIRNLGKLTIKDSATGGTITTLATNPDDSNIPSYANNTIRNEGELILESGTVKNETNSGACFAIDNYSTNSSVTINGGNVTAVRCAIRLFANSNTATNSLVINNGEITGKRAVWIHLPSSADNVRLASVTVNGGILTSTAPEKDLAIYVYSYGDSYAGTEITITNGVFNGCIGLGGGSAYNGTGAETLNITGGTFNYEVFTYNTVENINISGGTYKVKPADEYVAIDYIVKPNEDGTYGIVEETVIFGGVYARINMPILEEDGKEYYQVTFYSGIDSLKYKEVGFELYVDGVMFAKSATNTVYGAISGVDENGDPIRVTAQELGSYRIFALTAQLAVEDNWDDTPIIFRSYALDLNGNTIYGGFWMIDDIYTKE